MSQWIKTETHHPVPLIDVLVVIDFDDDPFIDMGFQRANGDWFLTGSNPLVPIKPTHWMHLPELPK